MINLQASSAAQINASVLNDTVEVGVNHSNLAPAFYSGVINLRGAAGSAPLIGDPECVRGNAWVLPADDDVPGQMLHWLYLPNIRR